MKDKFWFHKNVFITGITGFLGSWLAKELVNRGAKVTGLVRDQVSDTHLAFSGTAKHVNLVNGALEDFELLSRTLLEYETDYCFHLAAQAVVGSANQNPLPTFESNIRGTWQLLEAARRYGKIKGLVVASSDKAYGSQKVPYTEDMALSAQHPYDVSKLCAEYVTNAYYHTYRLPVAITRCANLYGGGDMNFSRIVPGTVRSLFYDEAPVIRSDGSPVRDYIYVEDAVKAYLCLAENMTNEAIWGQAFNFGTSHPVSVLDLVSKIVEISGKSNLKPDVQGKGKMHGEIDRQFLSSEKARKQLGWQASTDLNDGLKEAYSWYERFFEASSSEASPIATA